MTYSCVMDRRLFALLVCLLGMQESFAWGFWAHRRINEMACYVLPEPMFGFYKAHIDYVREHATDPDLRRYRDPSEAPRHFIDLDRYGEHPLDSLPHRRDSAAAKYTEDTLQAHGTVPYTIAEFYRKLLFAFRDRDRGRILYYSAMLGHYIGDAHVPLHCTRNYNGQLTGQHGIHGFWESRLPEMFGNGYDYLVGPVGLLEDPDETAWKIIGESYAALDSVLHFERELGERFPEDRKYAYESRGSQVVRVYAPEYSENYHLLLDGQVERRMQQAIRRVAMYWYTAWLEAGQPDLPIDGAELAPLPTDVFTDKVVVGARVCEGE